MIGISFPERNRSAIIDRKVRYVGKQVRGIAFDGTDHELLYEPPRRREIEKMPNATQTVAIRLRKRTGVRNGKAGVRSANVRARDTGRAGSGGNAGVIYPLYPRRPPARGRTPGY